MYVDVFVVIQVVLVFVMVGKDQWLVGFLFFIDSGYFVQDITHTLVFFFLFAQGFIFIILACNERITLFHNSFLFIACIFHFDIFYHGFIHNLVCLGCLKILNLDTLFLWFDFILYCLTLHIGHHFLLLLLVLERYLFLDLLHFTILVQYHRLITICELFLG